MLFDATTSGIRAQGHPAPGSPAGLGESIAAAADDIWTNQLSVSARNGISNEYDRYISELEKETGKRLENPIRPPTERERRALGDTSDDMFAKERGFFSEVSKLGKDNPNLKISSPEEIRRIVAGERKKVREHRKKVEARQDTATAILSNVIAAPVFLADPPVLLTMPLGASFSASILRGALIDAGIIGATEIPIQAKVQLDRPQFGEKPDFGEAALNVASATIGGGIFSGLIRGFASGSRALIRRARETDAIKTAEQEAAAIYLERQADLEETTPFAETPRARDEHAERLSEAMDALAESRVADIPEAPRHAAIRPARTAEGHAARETVSFNQGPLRDAEENIKRLGSDMSDQQAEDVRQLARREIAAVFGDVIENPEELAVALRELRRGPDRPRAQSLTDFLRREGGLREESGELKTMGITGRSRPGLVNRRGMTFDDASLRAFEDGFFPELSERPTVREFLDALDEDFKGTKPRFRSDEEDALAEFDIINEGLEQTRRAMDELGISPRDLDDEVLAQRIRSEVERAQESVTTEGTSRGIVRAHESTALLDRAEAQEQASIDALEATVRTEYEGRLDENVFIEAADGTITETKAGRALDDLSDDEVLLAEFENCMRGL